MTDYRAALTILACLLVAACGSPGLPPLPLKMASTDQTAWTSDGPGFRRAEALALLEFSIALEFGSKLYKDAPDNPQAARPDNTYTNNWQEIFPRDAAVDQDPDPPGLGPYGNTWKLYKKLDEPNVFAIAIRGTIDDAASAVEDVIATSAKSRVLLEAEPGKVLRFTLAQTPGAEVHLGFLYGLTAVMFDKENGILHELQGTNLVPNGSKIFITGHSQGAAIATLVHAFLHYAMVDTNPDEENPAYSLRDRHYRLKSYVFAQPKPGNWQFAMDFARIAASEQAAFVINNNLDWVPQVPLSIEFFDEPGADLALAQLQYENPLRQLVNRILVGGSIAMAQGIRGIDAAIGEEITIGDYQRWFAQHPLPEHYLEHGFVPYAARHGISINYALAGDLVPVFGSALEPTALPSQAGAGQPDPMLQHHGTTYRTLLNSDEYKGGLPPCVADPALCGVTVRPNS